MFKIVLVPVPGRVLRVLLLRLEPDERLWAKFGRDGSLVRLSRRSSSLSLELSTSQTEDRVSSFFRAAAGGGVTSAMEPSEPSCESAWADRLASSSEDQLDETVDK